jgi:hypothetical protein
MDVAEGKPYQLAPSVGPIGSGSTGSPASSPISIDSLSSIIINIYLRSSGSLPASHEGFNVTFGTLDFHVDNTGAILLLPAPETASPMVDSMS